MMKVVCAWCTKTMKIGKGRGISHGICKICTRKFNKQLSDAKKRRSRWQSIKLFWQFMTGQYPPIRRDGNKSLFWEFMTGQHHVVRQREVLI